MSQSASVYRPVFRVRLGAVYEDREGNRWGDVQRSNSPPTSQYRWRVRKLGTNTTSLFTDRGKFLSDKNSPQDLVKELV